MAREADFAKVKGGKHDPCHVPARIVHQDRSLNGKGHLFFAVRTQTCPPLPLHKINPLIILFLPSLRLTGHRNVKAISLKYAGFSLQVPQRNPTSFFFF